MITDKKEKAEKLLSAIGEIDADLIKEAEEESEKTNVRYIKPLAAVAAAVILLTVSLSVALNSLPEYNSSDGGDRNNMMNGNSGAPPENSQSANDGESTLTADGASLTLLDRSESVYTFRLVITEEQEAIEITLRGEGVDEWGEDIFVISTTADYAELTHIPKSPPKITVNGEDVTKIPTAPGEYTVTVDFSELESEYLWRNYFTVAPFGNILR